MPYPDDRCRGCGSDPEPGRRRCTGCAAAHSAREAARRQLLREQRRCVICGSEAERDRRYCRAHLEQASRRRSAQAAAWRAEGLCPHCGGRPARDRIYCQASIETRAERAVLRATVAALRSELEDARSLLIRAKTCIALVSGALCDAETVKVPGYALPEPGEEAAYGDAVRALAAERDRMREQRDRERDLGAVTTTIAAVWAARREERRRHER